VGADGAYLIQRWRLLRGVVRGDLVSPAFRERLMLTVTGVNRCRYCAVYHRGTLRARVIWLTISEFLRLFTSG
jgi:AhpD family alkylhydroperoxidase